MCVFSLSACLFSEWTSEEDDNLSPIHAVYPHRDKARTSDLLDIREVEVYVVYVAVLDLTSPRD